jgi:hypothetical protein
MSLTTQQMNKLTFALITLGKQEWSTGAEVAWHGEVEGPLRMVRHLGWDRVAYASFGGRARATGTGILMKNNE